MASSPSFPPFGVTPSDALARRAKAAYWSRFWLVLSAVVSWIAVVFGPTAEGIVAGVLLTGMSVVEFRVYRFFRAGDLRGADYGWWNQCLFAALFLIYGGYHGTFVTIPPSLQQSVDFVLGLEGQDESALVLSLHDVVSFTYYSIALVGGIAQFWLACYYRAARR